MAAAARQEQLIRFERQLYRDGFRWVAGADEAGRGPLAGPVVAAAAVFHPYDQIDGVDDSKKLTEKRRESVFNLIMERALDVGVGIARQDEIDAINILRATKLAMRRAVGNLRKEPDCLLIDALLLPEIDVFQKAIVGGDARCRCIAGASIVAKVIRDRIMRAFDVRYPGYGFSRNKGYPTREHLAAIKKLGIVPIHRRSYAPVREVIESGLRVEKSAGP